ncbi:type II toxin-antitoxin system HicA family toxin [Bacillus safensis]|uniref:type II toxin-antitoxin system HicA family toxin n=1 Tax=Bacillus safensis TaxID=561879 RepID=UPI003662203C
MKATKLRQILKKRLGYTMVPGSGGSHTWFKTEGRPDIRWAYHNGRNLAPREVRNVLVQQAGLSIDEAKEVLGVV